MQQEFTATLFQLQQYYSSGQVTGIAPMNISLHLTTGASAKTVGFCTFDVSIKPTYTGILLPVKLYKH